MVAVDAARLADTALPSAALSGCRRISIKAQYLDASKGSDVTAVTQDWLLHLHQRAAFWYINYKTEHTVQRSWWRPTHADAAHGRWPWQCLELLSPNVTQFSTTCFLAKSEIFQDTSSSKASAWTYFAVPKEGPLSHLPVPGSFPVTTAFTSSLLKGFMLSGHPQNLPETVHGFSKLLQHLGVLKAGFFFSLTGSLTVPVLSLSTITTKIVSDSQNKVL